MRPLSVASPQAFPMSPFLLSPYPKASVASARGPRSLCVSSSISSAACIHPDLGSDPQSRSRLSCIVSGLPVLDSRPCSPIGLQAASHSSSREHELCIVSLLVPLAPARHDTTVARSPVRVLYAHAVSDPLRGGRRRRTPISTLTPIWRHSRSSSLRA